MLCPKCNSIKVVCVDSRPKPFGTQRRKKCNDCGYKFHTVEVAMNNIGILRCEACPWSVK